MAKTDDNFTALVKSNIFYGKDSINCHRTSTPGADQILIINILATEISLLITVRSLIPPYLESL